MRRVQFFWWHTVEGKSHVESCRSSESTGNTSGQSVNDCDVAAEEKARQVNSCCRRLARTEKKLTMEIWWRMHVGQHVSGNNRR